MFGKHITATLYVTVFMLNKVQDQEGNDEAWLDINVLQRKTTNVKIKQIADNEKSHRRSEVEGRYR